MKARKDAVCRHVRQGRKAEKDLPGPTKTGDPIGLMYSSQTFAIGLDNDGMPKMKC
jgi:hypothetical protein